MENQSPSMSKEAGGRHIIDVELCAGDRINAAGSREHAHHCAVCNLATPWVAVGQCGHRAVCPKCMVRLRFFHRDKRCHTCKTPCSKVLITRTNGGAAFLPVSLPSIRFRDGKVGNYWYHKHTAAYFEDEQEYQAAKTACHGILSPFYEPLFCYLPCLLLCVAFGAAFGHSILYELKTPNSHRSLQITIHALSILVLLSMGNFFWYLVKRTEDPLTVEALRVEGY